MKSPTGISAARVTVALLRDAQEPPGSLRGPLMVEREPLADHGPDT
jgi:hypothetical protein